MIQFLSTSCLLGVVVVGLLLMTSAIRLEQVGTILARGVVAVILIWWAICLVKELIDLVLPAVPVAIHWIGIAALVVAGLVFFTALTVRLARQRRKNSEGGDL